MREAGRVKWSSGRPWEVCRALGLAVNRDRDAGLSGQRVEHCHGRGLAVRPGGHLLTFACLLRGRRRRRRWRRRAVNSTMRSPRCLAVLGAASDIARHVI